MNSIATCSAYWDRLFASLLILGILHFHWFLHIEEGFLLPTMANIRSLPSFIRAHRHFNFLILNFIVYFQLSITFFFLRIFPQLSVFIMSLIRHIFATNLEYTLTSTMPSLYLLSSCFGRLQIAINSLQFLPSRDGVCFSSPEISPGFMTCFHQWSAMEVTLYNFWVETLWDLQLSVLLSWKAPTILLVQTTLTEDQRSVRERSLIFWATPVIPALPTEVP